MTAKAHIMKQILLAVFFLPFSINLSAQEADDSAQVAISAEDSAASFAGHAAQPVAQKFEVKREKLRFSKVYQVNAAKSSTKIYDRALGYARMLNAGYKEDQGRKTIHIPVTWKYTGGANECIENLDLSGDLVVEVKDLKTRISLTDINYTHRDRNEGIEKGVAKSDIISRKADCAPTKGQAELLYNCSACNQSLGSLDKNLKAQFEFYTEQYQERLKKY
jgi:hypothetical protein